MSRLILTIPEFGDPDRTLATLGQHLRLAPDETLRKLGTQAPVLEVPLGTPLSSDHLRRLQRLLDDLRGQGAAPRLFHVGDQGEFHGPDRGHRELAADRPLSQQISPGGSFTQAGRNEAPAFVSEGDPELIRAVGEHVTKHVGPVAFVIHEERSTYVHVDVHVVAPSAERPCWTLVTSGLAEKPMRAPSASGAPFDLVWAELMISLPPDWSRERLLGWPVDWLQWLARYPHRYDTWLGYGHTVPFRDEETVPGTGFVGAMLMKPVSLPAEFHCFRPGGVRHLHVYGLYPLTPEEMDYKLQAGADALAGVLIDAGVDDVVDPRRRSVCVRANRAMRRSQKRR